MACDNCASSSGPLTTYNVQYFYSNNCNDCSNNCPTVLPTTCVYYAGPNLPCSGINTNDSVELALQKIDLQICSASGDYSTYNFNCLTPVATEAEFVNQITNYVCTLRTDFTTFTNTTFVSYQNSVNSRFQAIEVPGVTCTSAGVVSTDTLNQILTKYCNKFANLDSSLNLSGVNWSQCFSVGAPPTTIHDAFSLVVDQICQVKNTSGAVLPTFNNNGSCLPSPGTADSLVDTVEKIKTRLCQSPTFDINALSWGCTTKPSSTTTDLQAAFQTVLNTANDYKQNKLTFSSDFVVSLTNPSDPCQGKTVALATPINQDRFVASNSSDTAPGTLADKLQAGTNISLDYLTTPGKVIINNTVGVGDHKVLANVAGATPDYLDNKVEGASSPYGISIGTAYNGSSDKVQFTPTVDLPTLVNSILTLIGNDATLKQQFCELVSACPSPCDAPTNVQAIPA